MKNLLIITSIGTSLCLALNGCNKVAREIGRHGKEVGKGAASGVGTMAGKDAYEYAKEKMDSK